MKELKPEYVTSKDGRSVTFTNREELRDTRMFGWNLVYTSEGEKFVKLDEAHERITELEKELDEAYQNLVRYSSHRSYCHLNPCDCGLSEVLDAVWGGER